MARSRDYAAEYARRQSRARAQGFTSYWHQRQIRREIKVSDPAVRGEIERKGARFTPAEWRREMRRGEDALRRGDKREANRIARRLGFRDTQRAPGYRAFYYH